MLRTKWYNLASSVDFPLSHFSGISRNIEIDSVISNSDSNGDS